MLKKYLHLTIIGIIQIILPITAFMLLTPYLLSKTNNLHQLQALLANWHLTFLIIHGLFYCVLFYRWPAIVRRLCHHRGINLNGREYKQALSARWYLLSAFILFELLMLWR